MKEIFKHDFNAKTIQLNENYRSARKIVKLINLFKNENESLSKYPIEGVVKYTQYDNEEEEAKDIINKIKILVSENGIKYDEIAILGRNSYLFNSIIEQLKKENIPFNIGAQSNLEMETKTGKLLLEYIKLLANPYNERIRNEFQQLLELDNNEVSLIKQFMEKDYPDVFNIVEKSIKSELVFKMELENYIKKITKTTNMIDEEKFLLINDMKTLIENWNNYLKRSKSQNKNLKIFLNDFTMGKTMTFNFEGVSLLTIHKSKGLEYDTTFVVGLNEGTLPDYRSLQGDDLVEEDNNVYVALSRAKRRCFISSVKNKIMPWGKNKIQKESRYVEIIKKIEE